jgi:hypothetical protein
MDLQQYNRTRLAVIFKGNNMNWIKNLWARITLEIRYRKKLKELRKRDPFIYK